MSCDNCEHGVHIKCDNISPVEYNNMCKCDNIIWSCPKCKQKETMNQTLHNGQTGQSTPIINNQVDAMNTSNISTGSNTSISSTRDNHNLLTILTMNCRSLKSEAKINELNTIIETHQPHIIHLQETHLDKSIPISEILDPERYEVVRKDRTCTKGHEGGGVINSVRKDTVCSSEDTLDTDCEIAWTKIQLKGCKALYTGCFYRKPDNEPSALEKLNNSLSRLTHNSTLPNVILTGDFNLPDIDWD